mgnify:CR=1 FL=1
MVKRVKKVWGQELWIVNTDKYCGKILQLKEGHRSSLHMHRKKDETFYILGGKVLFELDRKRMILRDGDVIRIRPGSWHRFTGLTDAIIIEFSTHHSDKDVIRKTRSERICKSVS